MPLKKATQLTYLCLIASLVLSLLQWIIYNSGLISYGSFSHGLATLLGLLHIALSIPLILFFAALNAKQKSSADQRPE